MKYVLAFTLVCLCACAAPSYAQEAAKPADPAAKVDVTGVWDMVVESPQGAMDLVATFKQEGEKLTGTQASPMGEIALEGTVVGTEIKYVINIDMNGQQMAIAFGGKVDGEAMAGIFEFGGMGSAPWNAKKRKQ